MTRRVVAGVLIVTESLLLGCSSTSDETRAAPATGSDSATPGSGGSSGSGSGGSGRGGSGRGGSGRGGSGGVAEAGMGVDARVEAGVHHEASVGGGMGGDTDALLDATAPSNEASLRDASVPSARDATVRNSTEGGTPDAGTDTAQDAAFHECPRGAEFPVGTWYLDLFVEGRSYNDYPPGPTITEACALARRASTLTITYDATSNLYRVTAVSPPDGPYGYDVSAPSASLSLLDGGGIALSDHRYSGVQLDLTIDGTTTVIPDLRYSEYHAFRGTYSSVVTAVGWPACAASNPNRPASLPAPPPPGNCDGRVSKPGCSWSHTFANGSNVVPSCPATLAPGCTCSSVADGYELSCCSGP